MKKINLFLIILFGLGFLSIIGDTLRNPATLALLIPITLIVCFSPIGKAIANVINGKTTYSVDSYTEIQDLKNKYNYLQSKIDDYEKEVEKLRETVVFYDSKIINNKKTSISLDKKL